MAIERYVCQQTGVARLEEIKTWMEENASDYFTGFDIITEDASANVRCLRCHIGEVSQVEIRNEAGSNSVNDVDIILSDSSHAMSPYRPCAINVLYKTSCGIFFMATNNTLMNFFVSKTDDGKVAIAGTEYTSYDSSGHTGGRTFIVIPELPTTLREIVPAKATSEWKSLVTTPAEKTTPVPLCFSTGQYTSGLFRMAFFKYPATRCEFTLNNVKYVTDGVFALKE